MTTAIKVEVSAGELIDKITILQIKRERIAEPDKLQNICKELAVLETARDEMLTPSSALQELTAQLKAVNLALWQVEDDIRRCEHNGDFGPVFIELARSVYRQNDERAVIKRNINQLVGSSLMEEKSYAPWAPAATGASPERRGPPCR